MKKISYMDFRLDVLDDFFLCLVDKPKVDISYDEVLGYVDYHYEEGFSEIESFLVCFVLYVLCGKFDVTSSLSKTLKKNLLTHIDSQDFGSFIRQVVDEDRNNLFHDMYLVGLISKDMRDNLCK